MHRVVAFVNGATIDGHFKRQGEVEVVQIALFAAHHTDAGIARDFLRRAKSRLELGFTVGGAGEQIAPFLLFGGESTKESATKPVSITLYTK